jgi:hypothetical protein
MGSGARGRADGLPIDWGARLACSFPEGDPGISHSDKLWSGCAAMDFRGCDLWTPRQTSALCPFSSCIGEGLLDSINTKYIQ